MWPVNRWMQCVALAGYLLTGPAAFADPLTGEGSLRTQNGIQRSKPQGNYVAQPFTGREANGGSSHSQQNGNYEPGSVRTEAIHSDNSGLAIRTSSSDPSEQATDSGKSKGTVSSATAMITKTLGALFGVILLIVIVASVLKKQNPALLGGLPPEAVTVLGRRFVEQRQAIHLVRVGSRILILGSSTQGLSPLGEVTDPVEVDYLAGLCQAEESDGRVAKTIRGLFQRTGLSGKGTQALENAATPIASSLFAKRYREDVSAHELRDQYSDAMNYNPQHSHSQFDAEKSREELRG